MLKQNFAVVVLCAFLQVKVFASQELPGLRFLHSGAGVEYFVSDVGTDAITAAETCSKMQKNFKLLSIEDEDKFRELLTSLRKLDIESIWTSGLQAASNITTKYMWASNALPISYANFADILKYGSRKRVPRSVDKGYNYPIFPAPDNCTSCNTDYCPEKPKCEAPNCTITPSYCNIDQPFCNVTLVPDCYVIDPQPICVVDCPPCTITRGDCTITRPKCSVKPGKCTTSRTNCRLFEDINCSVQEGKCSVVQPPCEVVKPSKPCVKPPKCSYKPHCDPINPTSVNNTTIHDAPSQLAQTEKCTGKNCPGTTAKPCEGSECKCYTVFHCVPDIVCIAPPVICPPAIYHCLPPHIDCPQPQIICDDPITICDPPIVDCPPYEKHCTEDIIVCPSPKTTCTPAVIHCPREEYHCLKPGVHCTKPVLECEKLTKYDCVIAPPCYDPGHYPSPGNCHNNASRCNRKRDKRSLSGTSEERDVENIFDNGSSSQELVLRPDDVIETKCIALKKSLDFKWNLEECDMKNHFICERSVI